MGVFFLGHRWDGDSGPGNFGFLRRGVGSGCIWHGGWRVDCFVWIAAGSHGGGLCLLRESALVRIFLFHTLVQRLLTGVEKTYLKIGVMAIAFGALGCAFASV